MIYYKSIFIVSLFFLIACNNTNKSNSSNILTLHEFTIIYKDSLDKNNPNYSFIINEDYSIFALENGDTSIIYPDNAYIGYKEEPDSLNSILCKYLSVFEYTKGKIDTSKALKIVPVIKSKEFFNQFDSKTNTTYYKKYNDELFIMYAIDLPNSTISLNNNDFKKYNLNKENIINESISNIDSMLIERKWEFSNNIYMASAGGDYEASLILIDKVWNKNDLKVDGDFVIAVPNRDILMVTGSNQKDAISLMKKVAEDSFNDGQYQISPLLFIRKNGKFEVYNK